jgi:hypothetical protein
MRRRKKQHTGNNDDDDDNDDDKAQLQNTGMKNQRGKKNPKTKTKQESLVTEEAGGQNSGSNWSRSRQEKRSVRHQK